MSMFILDSKVLLRVVLEIAEKKKNLFSMSLNRYYYTRWWLKREKGCLYLQLLEFKIINLVYFSFLFYSPFIFLFLDLELELR